MNFLNFMKNLFILLFIVASLNVSSQNPIKERINQRINERLDNLFKSEIKENRQWRKENPRPKYTLIHLVFILNIIEFLFYTIHQDIFTYLVVIMVVGLISIQGRILYSRGF